MKQYYTGGQCQSCSCAIIPNPIIPAIYSVAGIFFSALWKNVSDEKTRPARYFG